MTPRCPACNGSGYVVSPPDYSIGKLVTTSAKCEKCSASRRGAS